MALTVVRVPPVNQIDPELSQIEAWEQGHFASQVYIAPLLYVEIRRGKPPWTEGHVLHLVVESQAKDAWSDEMTRWRHTTACGRVAARHAYTLPEANKLFNFRSWRWRLCLQCAPQLGRAQEGIRFRWR